MYAIVTAGGIPKPDDPLYEYTQGQSKALLDIAGKPMVQWVLDAVGASEKIEKVVMVGLGPDSGVSCQKPLTYIPNQGSMLDNVRASIDKVVELQPDAKLILMVSSDIPALTTEMVDWSIEAALETEDDLYYNIITREVMEARFPGSKRSFIKFKDAEICGGDMNIARASVASGNDELWERLISARKNPLKQAALFGFSTLFLMLTRRLSIHDAAPRVSKQIGFRGRVVFCPYAELAMDIDKPHQLDILRADLEKQVAASS
ncbi:NTP transferase domain-containing protein [Chloroflexota bacterium]